MQIGQTSRSSLQAKDQGGKWQDVKGRHIDVHDAYAHATNLILGGVDEVRITTIVEMEAVGRRRRQEKQGELEGKG